MKCTVSYPCSCYLIKPNPLIHLICQVKQSTRYITRGITAALSAPRSRVTGLLFHLWLLKNLQSKSVKGRVLCQEELYIRMHSSIVYNQL